MPYAGLFYSAMLLPACIFQSRDISRLNCRDIVLYFFFIPVPPANGFKLFYRRIVKTLSYRLCGHTADDGIWRHILS